MSPLSPRQQRFVAEYLIDLNATQAAIRAGYSAHSASEQASRLLANAKISDAVAQRRAQLADKLEISAERVLAELARIGFANMADYMHVGPDGDPRLDFSALTRDQAAALQEVTVDSYGEVGAEAREVKRVKFRLADKRAALVDLGKHLGLFVERHEVTGKGGGPIEVAGIRERVIGKLDRLAESAGEESEAQPAATLRPPPA